MSIVNPFDLLDGDAEDVHQIVAAVKTLKVEKVVPVKGAATKQPSQAGKEARNGTGKGRGQDGVVSNGRGGGGPRNFDGPRNFGGPRNENGNGGGYRASGEGDGARRRGSVGGYRGGAGNDETDGFEHQPRHGGFSNGEFDGFQRPQQRKHYDRRSGTGHGKESHRDGAGLGNWGTTEDDIPVTEESTTVAVKNVAVEKKEGGEDEATDAPKEPLTDEQKEQAERIARAQAEREEEEKKITFADYEKALEEKKKAQEVTKVEERKVDTKEFETMQQLSSKKSNNDEVFIKLGAEKEKRPVEKEEKAKKTLNLPNLRTARYIRPKFEYSGPRDGATPEEGGRGPRDGGEGGRGGRGPRDGGRGGRGPRDGGRGARGEGYKKFVQEEKVIPVIADPKQFPTLGQ